MVTSGGDDSPEWIVGKVCTAKVHSRVVVVVVVRCMVIERRLTGVI